MTNPMTAEEAANALVAMQMHTRSGSQISEAITLAINRLSEPSGELVEAAKAMVALYEDDEGCSRLPQVNRLRAAILSVEGAVK